MTRMKDGTNGVGALKYFPHLAGSLILASAGAVGLLHKWEPDTSKPDAHLYVYEDKIASNTLTVCSGLTNAVSKKRLIKSDKWTQQECNENEEYALEVLQNRLAACFTRLPPQSVFESATTHAWNFGVGKTCTSKNKKKKKKKDYALGCRLIAYQYDGTTPNWSFSDGKFVKGLHNRRVDEMQTCLKDVK